MTHRPRHGDSSAWRGITRRERLRPMRLLAVQVAVTSLLSALAIPLLEQPRLHFSAAGVAAIAFMSLTAVLTFWFQLQAQSHVSPTETALVFTLEPRFAVASSYLVLGETLGPLQWLGAALILAGTVLPNLGPQPTKARQHAPSP